MTATPVLEKAMTATPVPSSVEGEPTVTVPLRSRRLKRVQLVQKIQHAVPALGLLVGGAESLRAGAHGFELGLAVAGIATSALLIASIARGVRAARAAAPPDRGPDATHATHESHESHESHGIDWADIWAAGVLFAEAGETWHLRHHIARPVILTALVTFALGLFHGRIASAAQRRRSLRLTDDALMVGKRPFGTFKARWGDIASITITDRVAEIRTRAGATRRIDLSDLENAADIRAALQEAQARLPPAAQPILKAPA